MATLITYYSLSNIITTLLLSCFATTPLSYTLSAHHQPSFPHFFSLATEAIYQFGDSIADTGNRIRADPAAKCRSFPYGETFFHEPSGRCSDGLLMIDYFAKFLNLPLIDPYLNKDGNFSHGVNFAVAGASALNVSTLAEKYHTTTSSNLSLSVQLSWFRSYLNSPSFNTSDRKRNFAKALFFMGEIGGNDYNHAFYHGETMRDVYKMVPEVIHGIISSIKEMMDVGARRIAVPGNLPVGCLAIFLSLFKTNDKTMYDELKCLKRFNKLAQFHNDLLQESIDQLQKNHPNVAIVYVDYYTAFIKILRDATSLGFGEDQVMKACCGVGDDEYNFNINRKCGTEGVVGCKDPYKHISWDGTHLTQHAYQEMAKFLVTRTPSPFINVA